MPSLTRQHCLTPEQGLTLLQPAEIAGLMKKLQPGWSHDPESSRIRRCFKFTNYYETMAFVNALAWIAHREDHHPDLQTGYNRCVVSYTTHAVGGLSVNDFICAARIDELVPDTARKN